MVSLMATAIEMDAAMVVMVLDVLVVMLVTRPDMDLVMMDMETSITTATTTAIIKW